MDTVSTSPLFTQSLYRQTPDAAGAERLGQRPEAASAVRAADAAAAPDVRNVSGTGVSAVDRDVLENRRERQELAAQRLKAQAARLRRPPEPQNRNDNQPSAVERQVQKARTEAAKPAAEKPAVTIKQLGNNFVPGPAEMVGTADALTRYDDNGDGHLDVLEHKRILRAQDSGTSYRALATRYRSAAPEVNTSASQVTPGAEKPPVAPPETAASTETVAGASPTAGRGSTAEDTPWLPAAAGGTEEPGRWAPEDKKVFSGEEQPWLPEQSATVAEDGERWVPEEKKLYVEEEKRWQPEEKKLFADDVEAGAAPIEEQVTTSEGRQAEQPEKLYGDAAEQVVTDRDLYEDADVTADHRIYGETAVEQDDQEWIPYGTASDVGLTTTDPRRASQAYGSLDQRVQVHLNEVG